MQPLPASKRAAVSRDDPIGSRDHRNGKTITLAQPAHTHARLRPLRSFQPVSLRAKMTCSTARR
jgi:hypothetical protein